MLIKRRSTSKVLDKLHRGTVLTLVGLTIGSAVLLSNAVYRYYTVVRPERQLIRKQFEEEILKEGRAAVDAISPELPM